MQLDGPRQSMQITSFPLAPSLSILASRQTWNNFSTSTATTFLLNFLASSLTQTGKSLIRNIRVPSSQFHDYTKTILNQSVNPLIHGDDKLLTE